MDRGTEEGRAFVVKNRTQDTLIPLTQQHAIPGCRIYTDGWAGYSRLAEYGFDQRVVVHEDGFGRGSDTTNHIEAMAGGLKKLCGYYQGIQVHGEEGWDDFRIM